MFRTVFLSGSILLLATIIGCTSKPKLQRLPYYNTPDFTPLFLQSTAEADKQIPHRIADFAFTNYDGRTITHKDIEGRIHVADFIFTTCGSICPVMTEQMSAVEKAFKNDSSVAILSYSVTPWIDTPGRLRQYRASKGISKPNWYLLTGDKAAIYNLARTSYFAEEDLGFSKDSSEFLHTEHFILVDAHKRIRGIYNGTLQLEVAQLIKDIATLRQEDR